MMLEPASQNNASIAKAQIEALEKKQHAYNLIGRLRKIPGHTLFSYNTCTGEVKRAAVERCDTVHFISRKPLRNDRIVIEPNCYYEQALNQKNFLKRLKRNGLIQ